MLLGSFRQLVPLLSFCLACLCRCGPVSRRGRSHLRKLETNVYDTECRGQRESLFQLREKNENFSYSILHIETRREFLALNLRLRDENATFSFNIRHRNEIHYLQSRTSRREQELRLRQFSRDSDLLLATGLILSKEKGC